MSSLPASAIALSIGLYATHTMVPPTPGPIAAAGILGADLGLVILWGMLVALVALAAGWLFAVTIAARVPLGPEAGAAEPEAAQQTTQGPSAAKSITPVLLPIVLIVLKSVSDLPTHPYGTGGVAQTISFIGQPIVALLLGVFLAFLLPKKITREMLSTSGWVGESVVAASIIIVITGCGGSFGRVLQNSGIASVIIVL